MYPNLGIALPAPFTALIVRSNGMQSSVSDVLYTYLVSTMSQFEDISLGGHVEAMAISTQYWMSGSVLVTFRVKGALQFMIILKFLSRLKSKFLITDSVPVILHLKHFMRE